MLLRGTGQGLEKPTKRKIWAYKKKEHYSGNTLWHPRRISHEGLVLISKGIWTETRLSSVKKDYVESASPWVPGLLGVYDCSASKNTFS